MVLVTDCNFPLDLCRVLLLAILQKKNKNMGIVKSEQYIQCLQFYTHLCSNSYMNIKLLRLSMFSKTPKPKCKHPFYYIKD